MGLGEKTASLFYTGMLGGGWERTILHLMAGSRNVLEMFPPITLCCRCHVTVFAASMDGFRKFNKFQELDLKARRNGGQIS